MVDADRARVLCVRADLHCHSNASDGTRPPAEVMARARAAGLDAVALTDHDTVTGHAAARRALPAGDADPRERCPAGL
jgi:predicted metal-dependent phosphoesterase TrpH